MFPCAQQGKSFTDDLLLSILGTLVAWIVTSVIAHFLKRSRLRAALLTDIILNVKGAREQVAAVAALMDHVKAGRPIPVPYRYRVGEYLLYKSVQGDLPTYLRENELLKVIQCYHLLWTLDVSIEGLVMTLGQWEQEKKPLSTDQVNHAETRRARIDALCAVLPNETRLLSLGDLPGSYAPEKGAGTVVDVEGTGRAHSPPP